jgi:chromate transporter
VQELNVKIPIELDTRKTRQITPRVSLLLIFLSFAKISLTSFGGGLSGWMMRDFVQNRKWLSEQEFLTGLALAQAFPGVNVVNLSIWIGYSLRRGPGALVGALGIVVPAMLVVIGVSAAYDQLAHFRVAHVILAGIAAAAIGLSLQMGARAAWWAATSVIPVLIMVVTFLAISVFALPLIPVVLVMAAMSITAAFYRLKKAAPSGG